jgi:hypothetical protein
MHAQRRPTVIGLIFGAVLLTLVLVGFWAVVPAAPLGLILLVGVVAEVIIYGVLYVVQRRRHW